MRLTLRTLLAWRDRTLSTPDRLDMDTKVAASDAAHVLCDRIDRVVADASLAAPHGHAAADPNVVAEYLDNVLPGAALDGFERACLRSDDLLAEVAASHRMLAEVNLDPTVRPPLGRAEHARLLQAFRARAEAVTHTAAPVAAGMPDVAHAVVVTPAPAAALAPRTAPRSSRTAWLLAVSALLLLGVLSGVLAWSVGGGRLVARRDRTAAPGRALAEPSAQARIEPVTVPGDAMPPAAAVAADGGATPSPEPLDQPQPPGPPAAPVAAGAMAIPRPVDPAGPSSPPATAVAQPTAVPSQPDAAPPAAAPAAPSPAIPAAPAPAVSPSAVATVPFGDALAIAAKPVAPPVAAVMPATPPTRGVPPAERPAEPADAPAATVAEVAVIGDDALLVTPVDAGDDGPPEWIVARAGDQAAVPTRLLAPAFSRPAVEIDGVRILLTPGTLGTLTRDDTGMAWLDVDIGAVVVVGSPGPARLRLTAAGLDGLATTVPGAPIGFEVVRSRAPRGDGSGAVPAASVHLHATGAAVPWQQSEPPPAAADIPAGATLLWTTADPGSVRISRRDRTPAWLAALEPGDAFERAARSALGAALLSGDPAEPALGRLAGERRSEQRIAAAATLSLIGRHEPLAGLLVEASPRRMLRNEEWSRLERTAVPRALALDAEVAESFLRALEAAAPAGTGPLLVALAGGGDAEAIDAARRVRLVDALESPWLVVRRYAWRTLLELDPPDAVDRLRYRPDRAGELNADGVRWWRERIASDGSAAGGR